MNMYKEGYEGSQYLTDDYANLTPEFKTLIDRMAELYHHTPIEALEACLEWSNIALYEAVGNVSDMTMPDIIARMALYENLNEVRPDVIARMMIFRAEH